jgi:DNA-binding SARP family transcriptional activator/predicted ATPase
VTFLIVSVKSLLPTENPVLKWSMAVLTLSMLGPFIAALNDQPLDNFPTIKVQALLIYLAVERRHTHRREHLMELLWHDMPLESAQVNLRQTLYRLRKIIPEVGHRDGSQPVPLLLSDRKTVQLNPDADLRLDVEAFQDGIESDSSNAASLYRGDFLVDFYLVDSSEFEAWAEGIRENLRRKLMKALEKLAHEAIKEGDFHQAQTYAWRQLEIDRLRERAYRQLMTALANSGQRNAALAQYQICRRRLVRELSLEPSPETTTLYEQIQADALRATSEPPPTRKPQPGDMPVFMLTDIEGSTRLWDSHRQAMLPALLKHNAILEEHITRHDGRILELRGDGVKAVFEGINPLQCMLDIQKSLSETNWGEISDLRIRIGLHGVPTARKDFDYFIKDDKYYGPVLNHTSRIMNAGWGGQILVSERVHNAYSLPPGASWQDFGPQEVKNLDHPLHIFGLVHPDLPLQSFPSLRTGPTPDEMEPEQVSIPDIRHNLPSQPTPFIGRETELAALDKMFTDQEVQLVTIVGPGGMGKTRLAIACAEGQLRSVTDSKGGSQPLPSIHPHSDGVFFVDLAPLSDADHIVLAVSEALDIQFDGSGGETGTSRQQLLDYLEDKGVLLILDNFEHLLPGAELVSEMLQTAPGVQILVTSRERLGLRQEQLYLIPGLDFPDWETPDDAAKYPAVQLFLGAARRTRPDFGLVPDDLTHLTRICRKVGGMPLALELAAGWTELLPLVEIDAEIGRSLGFLETELQDVPDRHRSMRAIFDATWERLEPVERDFMQKLSVFRGGLNREAVKKMEIGQDESAVALRLLVRLVSKSLLQVNQSRNRYQVHELLRQYAQERLETSGEGDGTRNRG